MNASINTSHSEEDELIAAVTASQHALRLLTAISLRQVAPEVTLSQYEAMEAIAFGARRITDLAAALNVTIPTASQTCNLLASKRLINRRRAAKDRRSVGLSLTASGHSILEDVEDLRRSKTHGIFANCLSNEDRVVVIAALRAISLACEHLSERREHDRGAIGYECSSSPDEGTARKKGQRITASGQPSRPSDQVANAPTTDGVWPIVSR